MIAVTASLAAGAIGAAPAAADTATCAYFPPNIFPPFVSVGLTPDNSSAVSLGRFGNEIRLSDSGGNKDCGAATVTNTAIIGITDQSPGGAAKLGPTYLPVGDEAVFAPGFGNEPGSSDEIEYGIGMGPGNDVIGLLGTLSDGPVTARLGASGDDRYINLNARETTGIDQDVSMSGVDQVTFVGNFLVEADDDVQGRGGKGTGNAPIPIKLFFSGGPGDDLLGGGSVGDNLDGDVGNDTLLGLGAQDFLDGFAGNDTLRGGKGKDILGGGKGKDRVFGGAGRDVLAGKLDNDRLVGGRGRDVLNGGPGSDVCVGGKGADKFIGCEVEIG